MSARSVTGLSAFFGDNPQRQHDLVVIAQDWPPAPSSNFVGAGHSTVTASILSDFEKSKRGGTPESPGVRQ